MKEVPKVIKEVLAITAFATAMLTVLFSFAVTAWIQLDEHLYERSLRDAPVECVVES